MCGPGLPMCGPRYYLHIIYAENWLQSRDPYVRPRGWSFRPWTLTPREAEGSCLDLELNEGTGHCRKAGPDPRWAEKAVSPEYWTQLVEQRSGMWCLWPGAGIAWTRATLQGLKSQSCWPPIFCRKLACWHVAVGNSTPRGDGLSLRSLESGSGGSSSIGAHYCGCAPTLALWWT